MQGYLYSWLNKVNGKVYIGQTRRSIEERRKEYLTENSGHPISRAIQKYGISNFQFEVLEKVSVEKLDALEVEYISIHNSTNNNCGYNILSGGQVNRVGRHTLLIQNIEELIHKNESGKIMEVLENAKNLNKPSKRERYKTIPDVKDDSKNDSNDVKLLMSLISFFSHYSVEDVFTLPLDTWVSFAAFDISDGHSFSKNKTRAMELIFEKGWWKKIKTEDNVVITESVMNYSFEENKNPASTSRKITWTCDDSKESAFQFFDINKFYLKVESKWLSHNLFTV
jgi:group I intron endonuclease